MGQIRAREIEKRKSFGLSLLPQTRKIVLSYYQKKIKVELKENLSEVSLADKKCEQFLRKKILAKFPHDGIIGEEYSAQNSKGDFTWTLDPIDGTFSFVRGNPFFGTMLGLIHEDQAVMGIIDYPALKQSIYAIKGKGTFFKSSRPKAKYLACDMTKKTASLKESLLCHTGFELWSKFKKEAEFLKLQKAVKQERSWGDCYAYYLLATGQCEIACDPILAIWDLVPIKVISEEAGALFLNFKGDDSIYSDNAIAFNPHLKKEISHLLAWTS